MSDEADHEMDSSLRPAIGVGAAAFAASVARRTRAPGLRRAPIARVWRRLASAPLHRSTIVGVTLAPVLRISILAGGLGKSPTRTDNRTPAAFVSRAARTLAVPDAPSRPTLGVSVSDTASTVERLVARGARSDGAFGSATTRTALAIVSGASAADHVSRRVARPIARVLRARDIVSTAEATDVSVRAPAQKSVAAAVAPVLSVSEVNRVTEHVLRTMDRRISAFRERQGRS